MLISRKFSLSLHVIHQAHIYMAEKHVICTFKVCWTKVMTLHTNIRYL